MSNIWDTTLYYGSTNRTFNDIFPDFDTFKTQYNKTAFAGAVSDDELQIIYALLSGEFRNSPVANDDENQFEARVFSIIWRSGPAWARKVALQKTIREMTDDELKKGSTEIYNHATNPSTAPSTLSTQILNYITDQNSTIRIRNPQEAYALLQRIIVDDVSTYFIESFRPLFRQWCWEIPILYEKSGGGE